MTDIIKKVSKEILEAHMKSAIGAYDKGFKEGQEELKLSLAKKCLEIKTVAMAYYVQKLLGLSEDSK